MPGQLHELYKRMGNRGKRQSGILYGGHDEWTGTAEESFGLISIIIIIRWEAHTVFWRVNIWGASRRIQDYFVDDVTNASCGCCALRKGFSVVCCQNAIKSWQNCHNSSLASLRLLLLYSDEKLLFPGTPCFCFFPLTTVPLCQCEVSWLVKESRENEDSWKRQSSGDGWVSLWVTELLWKVNQREI